MSGQPLPVQALYRVDARRTEEGAAADVDRLFARLLASSKAEWDWNLFLGAVLAELEHVRGAAGEIVDRLEESGGEPQLAEAARAAEAALTRAVRKIERESPSRRMSIGLRKVIRPTVLLRLASELRSPAVQVAEAIAGPETSSDAAVSEHRRALAAIAADVVLLAGELGPGPHRPSYPTEAGEEWLATWGATCADVAEELQGALAAVATNVPEPQGE